jgi:hypothetical protein
VDILLLLIVAVIVAVVVWGRSSARARTSMTQAGGSDAVTHRGRGVFQTGVVGESHYQQALETLCGGRSQDGANKYVSAMLVLEDSNPSDKRAVRVDINGRTVGYLSKPDARTYRKCLAKDGHGRASAMCRAIIRGGWDRGDGDRGHFGVLLDLPAGYP